MNHSTKMLSASIVTTVSMLATLWMFMFTVPFAVAQQSTSNAEAGAAESFDIPEEAKTAEQLYDFVAEIADTESDGQTEQELIAHQRKIAHTVINVADKVLSIEPSDEEAMRAYSFKLQALQLLKQTGVPEAEKEFDEVIADARADSRPDVAAVGMKYFIESGFGKWATLDEGEKAALINAIVQYVNQSGSGVEQLQLILTVVDFLGDMQNDELAKQLLNESMPGFRKSSDEQVKENLPMLEGIARRINLPGEKMKLSGTMLDGSALDWSSYRGKVVLVDFWATWCGPCRAEVPNVINMYQAYHEKGFDVLGISLDNSAEEALSYIEQNEIPWATLFSEKEDEHGWEHPMARYYGITGIPRAILVDRDGAVVSMNARGEELGRLLRKMLGEPLAETDTIEDKSVQQASNQAENQ